jgi:intein-encoded DNA endonuclease-like protein
MKEAKTKERFVELRAEGWSYERIARELRVSKQTLIDWSHTLEMEIQNLRAIQIEMLQEKYALSKEQKIELFGERLEAIKKELLKRDFSDVPTEKLFDLLLKCSIALQNETAEAAVFAKEVFSDFTHTKTWKG